MLTRSTGNTGGLFVDIAAMQAASSPIGRRLELYDGSTYQVSAANDGNGLALTGGNFANPVSDPLLSKVIPFTTSGTLVAGLRVNQLRDSGAFDMPLASSVDIDKTLVVELPDTYSDQTPSLTRTGSDLFENNAGTDTVINWAGAAKLTLTSDGVSKWRL